MFATPAIADDEPELRALTSNVNQTVAWHGADAAHWSEEGESDGCEDELSANYASEEIRDTQTAKMKRVRDRLREITDRAAAPTLCA